MLFIHFIKITVLKNSSLCTILHVIKKAKQALLSNNVFPMQILVHFPTFQSHKWSNKSFIFEMLIISKIKWSYNSVG